MNDRSPLCRYALLIAATVCLCGWPARSQAADPSPLYRALIPQLVESPDVQKELDLDAAAIEKIRALGAESRQEAIERAVEAGSKTGKELGAVIGRQDLSPEEKARQLAAVHRRSHDRTRSSIDKYIPRVQQILSNDQFQRVQQIHWQAAGAAALRDKAVIEALALSSEQQEKIAQLLSDFDVKYFGRLSDFRADRKETDEEVIAAKRKRLVDLVEQRDAGALELLTAEQKATLTRLKGKPFDLTLFMPAAYKP